jgi:hypothetical protein
VVHPTLVRALLVRGAELTHALADQSQLEAGFQARASADAIAALQRTAEEVPGDTAAAV